MALRIHVTYKFIVAVFAIVIVLGLGGFGTMEYVTLQSSFCGGACHTMAEQYSAWKTNKHHADQNPDGPAAECVDCHFAPGQKNSLKAKYEGLRHLAAYLYDPEAPLPIRPVIPDAACLRLGCHAKEKFVETELKYSETVRFKHGVHMGDKALEGQQLTCDTCHFKVSAKKHFEVPKDICFLCHLKLEKPSLERAVMAEGKIQRISFAGQPTVDFNQGASKCDICHTIPTKSLQVQVKKDDPNKKAITHQTLQKAGVPCESCHFEVVKGAGEIDTGNVVSNGCLTCHNRSPELLAKSGDLKLMHESHIGPARADCFDCHSVVEHRNRTDHLDFVRSDCRLCHEAPHLFQKQLLAGTVAGGGDIPKTPQLMQAVNTNCMACHVKKTVSKGHSVRTGSGDACVGCHTEEHRKMLGDWKATVDKEVKYAKELETEALEALKAARGKVAKAELDKARAAVESGQANLHIVEFGNGVHNKKYSVMLLDAAMNSFEDAVDALEGAK